MQKRMVQSSLADRIVDALSEDILSGALKPGDRLIELRIAEEMGTSQAPVREALHQLEALGLVETRRNRGAVVRRIDAQELREIYAVRAELEGLAAEIAAQLRPDIAPALLELCDAMAEAIAAGDRPAFVGLNESFHRIIVEASANSVLLEIWTKLDIRARTYANLARSGRPLDAVLTEHRAIASAIGQGAGDLARAEMAKHINAVIQPNEPAATQDMARPADRDP